ncbi:hypothetical protein J6590_089595 [Homalodisca vitripennis]|nr:hypothetical protein J6590_089595 [Homalodisca vitripennis]
MRSHEHFRESEVLRETHSYQNNALWNAIFPEHSISLSEDSVDETSSEQQKTIMYNIKKRYTDYKNFYRLKHLQISKNEKPLALTIGKHNIKDSLLSKRNALKSTVSFSDLHQIISTTDLSADVSNFMMSVSDQPLKHKSFEGRLPKLKTTSLDSVVKDINMNEISDLVSRLSAEQVEEPITYFTRESTASKLRDSVLLTRQRLSKCSSKDIKPGSEGDKIDALSAEDVSSSDGDDNWNILLDRRDSLVLAQTRLERTSRDKATEGAVSCDICNNRLKSIHFLCSFHANLFGPDGFHGSQFSIAPDVNIVTEHRDSLQIIRKKAFTRQPQPSVSCQILEHENPSPLSGIVSTQSEIVKRGGQNINQNLGESTKSKEAKVSPSKLNEYLMSSVKINQVVINNKKAIK